MKRWIKYADFLKNGCWHVHTSYTDGENSVDEYCKKACELKFPLIAFTEHVRKNLDYDFDVLIEDVKRARETYRSLIILVGCETKVLDLEGNLDIDNNVIKKCEIVFGAFHSFPFSDKKDYIDAIKNMLRKNQIDVWAHPTYLAQKRGYNLFNEEIKDILNLCIENNVLIEYSLKYDLPKKIFLEIGQKLGVNIVRGRDAHNIKQIERHYQLF